MIHPPEFPNPIYKTYVSDEMILSFQNGTSGTQTWEQLYVALSGGCGCLPELAAFE